MNWKMTKYCTYSEYGTIDNKTVLESEDDVANVKLGDGWRTGSHVLGAPAKGNKKLLTVKD